MRNITIETGRSARVAFCCGVFLLFGIAAVQAQTVRGTLVAKSYGAIPEEGTIAIDVREDTELNARLRDLFEQELVSLGFTIDLDAALLLSFETLIEERMAPGKPATVYGQSGSREGTDVGFSLQLPFSKPKLQAGNRRYNLNVTVARRNKPPLWVASASAITTVGDRFQVQSAMTTAAVSVLGQTVESHTIILE